MNKTCRNNQKRGTSLVAQVCWGWGSQGSGAGGTTWQKVGGQKELGSHEGCILMDVCSCMHACVCTYVFLYGCASVCVCMHMRACMYMYAHMAVCRSVHACAMHVSACICVCIHVHICVHVCRCVYIHVRVCTCLCTHVSTCMSGACVLELRRTRGAWRDTRVRPTDPSPGPPWGGLGPGA